MGKQLTEAQKKANKKKLDELNGRPAKIELPEGEAPPTGIISREIFDQTAKLSAIASNADRAADVVQDFQKQLDEARAVSAEASVNAIVDDTEDARKIEGEALKNEEMLRLHFESSRHQLKMLPDVLKKIRGRIKELQTERRIQEDALIKMKITDLDEVEAQAREAIARLVAYKRLTGSRIGAAVGGMNVGGIVAILNNRHDIDIRYKQIYKEMEASLHFEEL
jgi:hypothetical protein